MDGAMTYAMTRPMAIVLYMGCTIVCQWGGVACAVADRG